MPGIAGIISPWRHDLNKARLYQMIQSMKHEPFYTSGFYINEPIGLWIGWVSHNGSFSDCQPIWNERKDICIIFSGEDFTDPGEIETLKFRGHKFESGNASYLVHLYEEMGSKFIETLNGRFNGVVIDLREQSAVLFNDRFGLNRVYYHEDKEGFYFSSEAKSLLQILPALRQLDVRSLAEFFSCGCALQNRTLFRGISLVPGGSAWRLLPGESPRKTSYFAQDAWERQEPLDRTEYYSRFKETWIKILPRYTGGDRPVAVSLTGGKDSRMIMAWAQAIPGGLPCYTFGGLYRECMDVRLARSVARICRQPHRVIMVDKTFLKEFASLAERTVYLTDGAMDVSGAADLYVNQIARQIAPIRLTGNYGQEMLRGAIAMKPEPPGERMFEKDFGGIVKTAALTYDNELTGNRLSFAAFKQLAWFHYCRLAVELSQLTLRTPFLDNDLVALAYRAPQTTATSVEMQLRLIMEGNPELSNIGTDRAILYQSTPLLTKLQQLYQEFTFKAEYAYDYGMPQIVARLDHILKPFHLERLFLGRHKFHHFRIWYREELSEYVKTVLLDTKARNRSYLNGKQLENIVMRHIKGTHNYTSEIHKILSSELIQRRLIE